jgi:hypothetical protein
MENKPKYRQGERIAYNLRKSYEYLEGVSEEFKKGYAAALDHVKEQVERTNQYFANKENNN